MGLEDGVGVWDWWLIWEWRLRPGGASTIMEGEWGLEGVGGFGRGSSGSAEGTFSWKLHLVNLDQLCVH